MFCNKKNKNNKILNFIKLSSGNCKQNTIKKNRTKIKRRSKIVGKNKYKKGSRKPTSISETKHFKVQKNTA